MDKIASLKKEEKTRKKDIENLASEIERLEKELEMPPSQDLPTKDEINALAVCFSIGIMLFRITHYYYHTGRNQSRKADNRGSQRGAQLSDEKRDQ